MINQGLWGTTRTPTHVGARNLATLRFEYEIYPLVRFLLMSQNSSPTFQYGLNVNPIKKSKLGNDELLNPSSSKPLLSKDRTTYEEDIQTCPEPVQIDSPQIQLAGALLYIIVYLFIFFFFGNAAKSSLTDYESVPIQSFGMSMLKNMGWKEGQHVGRTPKNGLLKPIEYIPRPSLLGLGADSSSATDAPSLKRKAADYVMPKTKEGKVRHVKSIDEKLAVRETLQVNSQVKITHGIHSGLYGTVKELNSKDSKISLKSGERVRVPLTYIKLVSELDSRHSKLSSHAKESDELHASTFETAWLRHGLRVRIVSKTFKEGYYYNRKAHVLDVLPGNICVLRVENDKRTVLDQVPQHYLETIIPSVGGKVMVVRGNPDVNPGTSAKIMIKDKQKQECICALEEDESVPHVFSFDDICEIGGNEY